MAEEFESRLVAENSIAENSVQHSHESSSTDHHRDENSWEPRAGFERTLWTVLSNIFVSVGFALLLIPFIAWWYLRHPDRSKSILAGLSWGIVGWFCVFAWPALGLSPELPGEAAAGLSARQAWWLLAVASAVGGLWLLIEIRDLWRWSGLVLLALPFLIGAPHLDGSGFGHHPTDVMAQLAQLKDRFFLATAVASLAKWLTLGIAAVILTRVWISPILQLNMPEDSSKALACMLHE